VGGTRWNRSASRHVGEPIRSPLLVGALGMLMAVGAAGGVLASAGPAGAASKPPISVVSSSADPTSVVAGSSITFTWRITSKAGVTFTALSAIGPNGASLDDCQGGTLVSGSAEHGTFQQQCDIPAVVANGSWSTEIIAIDDANNETDAVGPGFTVTGGIAPEPPKIRSSSASPSTVEAGSEVTFTWRVSSQSGVEDTSIFAQGPGETGLPDCFGNGTLVAGNAHSGTYRQACIIPEEVVDGSWTTQISVQDLAGDDISAAGPGFVVTGGHAPVPPKVVSSAAAPSTVAIGNQVTFTWRVRDRDGVAYTAIEPIGPEVTLLSDCAGQGTMISGTAKDGTYQAECVIPAGSLPGPWSTFITVEDGADQAGYAIGPSFTVQPIVVTTTSLPAAVTGSRYAATLAATGGKTPYRWSLAAGSGPLPPGLRLATRGRITGDPKSAGTYPFTVQVADRAAHGDPSAQVQVAFTITVS
jgi:hypothetical protein